MTLFYPIVGTAPMSKEVSGVRHPPVASLLESSTDPKRSQQIMNRFLEESKVEGHPPIVRFVDSIDDYYDDADESPMEHDSNPDSPFLGKTAQECYDLILKLREDTESEIMPGTLIVMDERSKQDDTVLVMSVSLGDDYETEVLQTIRASFKASVLALILYESGHSSVEEDLELAAREPDNVYRGRGSFYG